MQTSKYIGIPFKSHGRDMDGMDCLGFVIHVYKEELGIALPDIADGYADAYAKEQVQDCVQKHQNYTWCYEVDKSKLKPFDVLIFRVAGCESHVGLYIGKRQMLHLIEGACSSMENIDSFKWAKRLTRVYRHVTR